jgi:hypothetical protein
MLMMQLARDNGDLALIMARRQTEKNCSTKARALVTEEAD